MFIYQRFEQNVNGYDIYMVHSVKADFKNEITLIEQATYSTLYIHKLNAEKWKIFDFGNL